MTEAHTTPQRLRCAVMMATPGSQGYLMQCKNLAVAVEHIGGCDCKVRDQEICEDGFDIVVCGGPHNFGQ